MKNSYEDKTFPAYRPTPYPYESVSGANDDDLPY
jgi:hypothetical protein